MNKSVTKFTVSFFILIFVAGIGYWVTLQFNQSKFTYSDASSVEINEQEKLSRVKAKKARNDYFFRLLRDPETNSIPQNIRSQELKHAKRLPTFTEVQRNRKSKNPSIQVAQDFTWQLAGPPAVGGRTRALDIDQRDPNTIIAGGVSGGIWKSDDGGDSWTIKTPDAENFAVTSLAQHPDNTNTWYYTSGEYTSSSAGAPGASYYGNGIFRSTDNGENWDRVAGTEDNDATFNSQFDYISRIIISPETGTIFTANNGFGVFRSSDGNSFNDIRLGGPGEHAYADVAVAQNGDLVAVLSSTSAGTPGGSPGIYFSTDDGDNWEEITPSDFPTEYHRSVITFAPSDPNIIYVLTQKDTNVDASNQGVSFFMLDVSGGVNNISSEDRSGNLPDFGDPVGGVNLQGGYNMTISVKPNDPNFVTIGGINLFRSRDGFSTPPADNSDSEKDEFWIGGYSKTNNVSEYPEQHPDQHIHAYDPDNPDRLWVGHDGGISVTDDVEAQSVSWTDRNDGYIVTQFYDVSIPQDENDNRLMGGTQDNGTPFFEYDSQSNSANASSDISTGDGGFSFFTENYIFVSNQQQISTGNNRVIRHDENGSYAVVQPSEAQTAFFINPYAIDPNDETVMYYPGGSSLYRNTEIDEITTQSGGGTTQGWNELTNAEVPGYNISALAVSTLPNDILYYAGSNDADPPVIKRLDNASLSNEEPQDISIENAPEGAFVHDIAINPANANDALVVMSNYNITGLYHTSDGGNSWEAIEGNLTGGDLQGSLEFGPSLRSATIIPSSSGPIYMLGTSTGVYATQSLNGSETEWGRESPFNNDNTPDIGFSVIENITSRFSNGDVAVGSHGRGIFLGSYQGEISAPDLPTIAINPSEGRAGDEVTINATNFEFDPTPSENIVLFDSLRAEVIEASPSQLTVIVPRSTIERNAEDRNVFIKVINENGIDPQNVPFTALPPQNFTLNQNYPNPFNPSTTISFDVPSDSRVTLAIYNMSGKKVLEPIYQDQYYAGTYDQEVNLNNLASGVYIYRIVAETSGGQTLMESQKMTLIK